MLSAVCARVWMLIRVAQIVTATHRDLHSCMHIPTNEPRLHTKNYISLTNFTGQNRPLKNVGADRHFLAIAEPHSPWDVCLDLLVIYCV